MYADFTSGFPYEETPDQQRAIEAVLEDMVSSQPMDRVVCGDVGFGKTEVALRAAYVAVQGQKQVAILVPTTLLAQQHFSNFSDRFADWPIRIELLSRFRTGKQLDTTLKDLDQRQSGYRHRHPQTAATEYHRLNAWAWSSLMRNNVSGYARKNV